MAGDAEQLGAGVVGAADASEPVGATAQNGRRHRDAFDIIDGGGAAIQADIGRERRLQARLAFLAFQALEQRGFLAADISPSPMMDIEVEIPAMNVVLADQPRRVSFIDGALQCLALADELAAQIDVAGMGAHREACHQAAFDQRVRIVAQDVAVLAGARLGFVGIDDQIMRPLLHFLGHEGPFQAGGEARAAAPAQARLLHDVDDGLRPQVDDGLGIVPLAALARALEDRALEPVQVGEDAILVGEHQAVPGFLGSAGGGGGGGGAFGTCLPMIEPS